MMAGRRPLALALLGSLLLHALLLGLTFGGDGPGWPGFAFPWTPRRIEVPALRLVLMPAARPAAGRAAAPDPVSQAPASNAAPAAARPGAGDGPLRADLRRPAQPPQPDGAAAPAPESAGRADPDAATQAAAGAATELAAGPSVQDAPVAAPPGAPVAAAGQTATPPDPVATAVEPSRDAAWSVPAASAVPMPALAAAPAASDAVPTAPSDSGVQAGSPPDEGALLADVAERDRLDRQAQAALQQAARLEAARIESTRLEAERQEAARQVAAQQEAARQEAARQEAARQEAARQEAARQEAARQEAVRQEAVRQEAVRQEAVRQEAARQEAARLAAARLASTQAEADRREALLRAIGRQLDEEAARREAASTPAGPASRPAPSSSGARRGRLFGRADANAELVRYAEAWARKIQLNMTFDRIRDAAKRPHAAPLVTVAIRSDGSVESVTFVLSSGVAEIDEAIRRIVQGEMPYPAFPPGLAREFDVIEIRRTWHFDTAIRLD